MRLRSALPSAPRHPHFANGPHPFPGMLKASPASTGPRYWIIRVICAYVCASGVCQSVGTAPSFTVYINIASS